MTSTNASKKLEKSHEVREMVLVGYTVYVYRSPKLDYLLTLGTKKYLSEFM